MGRRKKTWRKFSKYMKKIHDQSVNRIAEKPEILRINTLSSEKLVYQPTKFPELRRKGQETGDLILVWSSAPQEWEIMVFEVTVGNYQHLEQYFSRLQMALKYLKWHWSEWFKIIGLELPENYSLWIRILAVSYTGKALWEEPFKSETRRQLF